MKPRLPIVLSVTALVIAVAGVTPLGEAASDAIPRFARNADKVDGLHASRTPKAGRLLALNSSKKFPASVLPTFALSDLEVILKVSASDSSTPKLVIVNCPTGKLVVGGGARVTGPGANNVRVTDFYTTPPSRNVWTVQAVESPATGNSWQLTGTAICARTGPQAPPAP
jgi:hypothetical protein